MKILNSFLCVTLLAALTGCGGGSGTDTDPSPDPGPGSNSNSLLPDTGQTLCFDTNGNQITDCTGTGQDGEININPMSFTDNGDTVTDNVTSLVWKQSDDGAGRSWADANTYCSTLGSGWRLPTRAELVSIVDFGRSSPSMDPVFSASANSYWSSSAVVYAASNHWAVALNNNGRVTSSGNGYTYLVRCVK